MNEQLRNNLRDAVLLAVLALTIFAVTRPSPLPQGQKLSTQSAEARFDSVRTDGNLTFSAVPGQIVTGGGGLQIVNAQATPTTLWSVSNAGVVSYQQAITQTNGLVVVIPTSQATQTPGVIFNNQGGASNSLEVQLNSTPVFDVNSSGNVNTTGTLSVSGTPVYNRVVNSDTTNTWLKCTNSASVVGTVTATPLAGATPVGQPWASLAQAPTGDTARAYASYSAGVFTVGAANSALTPAANTTPASVEWCYTYNK